MFTGKIQLYILKIKIIFKFQNIVDHVIFMVVCVFDLECVIVLYFYSVF